MTALMTIIVLIRMSASTELFVSTWASEGGILIHEVRGSIMAKNMSSS